MALAARSVRLLAALLGAGCFSQLPAFADHYQQNLAGQITQARYSLEGVSRQAEERELSLRAYLESALADSGAFSRAAVDDSLRTLDRLDRLEQTQKSLTAATAFTRPLAMLGGLDLTTATVTAQHYQPNLPLGLGGAVYAGSGALLGLVLVLLPSRLTRRSAAAKTADRNAR